MLRALGTAAFRGSERSGVGGGEGKGGRGNVAREEACGESLPGRSGDEFPAVGCLVRVRERIGEVERSVNEGGGVAEGKEVGPGNIAFVIRNALRGKFAASAVFDFIIGGARVFVPFGAPTRAVPWLGGVARELSEEFTVVAAIGAVVCGVATCSTVLEVDLD